MKHVRSVIVFAASILTSCAVSAMGSLRHYLPPLIEVDEEGSWRAPGTTDGATKGQDPVKPLSLFAIQEWEKFDPESMTSVDLLREAFRSLRLQDAVVAAEFLILGLHRSVTPANYMEKIRQKFAHFFGYDDGLRILQITSALILEYQLYGQTVPDKRNIPYDLMLRRQSQKTVPCVQPIRQKYYPDDQSMEKLEKYVAEKSSEDDEDILYGHTSSDEDDGSKDEDIFYMYTGLGRRGGSIIDSLETDVSFLERMLKS